MPQGHARLDHPAKRTVSRKVKLRIGLTLEASPLAVSRPTVPAGVSGNTGWATQLWAQRQVSHTGFLSS